MSLSEDISGLRWRGQARYTARVHWTALLSFVGLAAFTSASVGLFFAWFVYAWAPGAAAVAPVAAAWLTVALVFGVSALLPALLSVQREIELGIEQRGVMIRLVEPLPWELVAVERDGWTGDHLLLPWNDLGAEALQQAGPLTHVWRLDELTGAVRAVRSARASLVVPTDAGRRRLSLIGVPPAELRRIVSVWRGLSAVEPKDSTETPAEWTLLEHPRAPAPWAESFRNLWSHAWIGQLPSVEQAPVPEDPLGTVDALRARLGRLEVGARAR